MKEAVGMDIRLSDFQRGHGWILVSLYHPSNTAARRERLLLSAIAMSSEQSRTKTIGDSAFVGFQQYTAQHGGKTDFVIAPGLSSLTVARDLGLSIARNANLVQRLWVEVSCLDQNDARRFFEDLFSVEGALPSLQSSYLCFVNLYKETNEMNVSPNFMKHLRGLGFCGCRRSIPPYLKQMIRNKHYGIEEVDFCLGLLEHTELLDDLLRNVRSFHVNYLWTENDAGILARSFERTKAEGDKLARLTFVEDCVLTLIQRR